MHEFYYTSPKEIQEFSFYLTLIVYLSNDNIKLQVRFYITSFSLLKNVFNKSRFFWLEVPEKRLRDWAIRGLDKYHQNYIEANSHIK